MANTPFIHISDALRAFAQQRAANAVGNAIGENVGPHVNSVRANVAHRSGGFPRRTPKKIDSGLFVHPAIVNVFTM